MDIQDMKNSGPELRVHDIAATAPLVMVTGPFGSGMEEFAVQLAHRMNVPFYDPHKLESLACIREENDDAWRHIKRSAGGFFGYWLDRLHERMGISPVEHLAYLKSTIQRIAMHGGVIAGACPHVILPENNIFRILVKASTTFCSRRLALTHGIDEAEAVLVFLRLEDERRKFLHELFEDGFMDSMEYDLVLDAEGITPEEMLATCLTALDQRGICVTPKENQFEYGTVW